MTSKTTRTPDLPRDCVSRKGVQYIWFENPWGLSRRIFTVLCLRLGLGATASKTVNYLFDDADYSVDGGSSKSAEQWVGRATRAARLKVAGIRPDGYNEIVTTLWAEAAAFKYQKTKDQNGVRWWLLALAGNGFTIGNLGQFVSIPSLVDVKDTSTRAPELALGNDSEVESGQQRDVGLKNICDRCVNNQGKHTGFMNWIFEEGAKRYATCINCGNLAYTRSVLDVGSTTQ